MTNSSHTNAEPVISLVPAFTAIAMIDDDLRQLSLDVVPESEIAALVTLLAEPDVLEDLLVRGTDAARVVSDPGSALELLTDPAQDLGLAFAKIGDVSELTQRLIGRRRMMRQIAAAIRASGDCEVVELGPDDSLADIARFDLVFIDYYLDDKSADGTRAEKIANEVQERRDATRLQQIVLMSTVEGVRAMRAEFRRNARIEAASFAFVSKLDLDEDWKVKAHLDMLEKGMQHSAALGEYIGAVKASAKAAAEALAATVDDLDIGDFAYIQRIALHADGHPLGDYLSWLLSSQLTAAAFETGLRQHQTVVDRMEFADGPLSPSEPSVAVASLYHNALFARNLGGLGGHPRAGKGSPIADVPFVQLGDVFLDADRTHAVVILSPDCDLAFSTEDRPPDRNLGVILLFGDPNAVTAPADKTSDVSTEGVVDGSEVYRIDWRFSTFQTVPLGELSTFLVNKGFDVSNRDRLRPIYSLKLQHELGNHLMRVGPPVMPPIARHAKSKIRFVAPDGVKDVALSAAEVVVSHFKKRSSVRLTPALISKLKQACLEHLDFLQDQLGGMAEGNEAEKKAQRNSAAKVQALSLQLAASDTWLRLLGDKPLPAEGKCDRLGGCVYLAHGNGWAHPPQPAVVLLLGEEIPASESEQQAAGDDDADLVIEGITFKPVPASGLTAGRNNIGLSENAPTSAVPAPRKGKPDPRPA